MRTLSVEELDVLREKIEQRLPEQLVRALVVANRNGKIEDLLKMLQMGELLTPKDTMTTYTDGKIVVIGGSSVGVDDLRGIAKKMGIEKSRIKYIDYHDAKQIDYGAFEYQPKICAVLFGATPHKTTGTGSDESLVAHMEKHRDRFPKVVRLTTANGKLKITKTNFRKALASLIDDGTIEVDTPAQCQKSLGTLHCSPCPNKREIIPA